jgi:hypothetical protein
MIEPTNGDDARAAREAAEARLDKAVRTKTEVTGIVSSLERMLQENHFSLRLARAMGLDDDRR